MQLPVDFGAVLGIETSCDETGIAIYCTRRGLLAQQLFSQVALHQVYGGVVPELASRGHIKRVLPLIEQVLQQAQPKPQDLAGIAYTRGPGLMGALLVGAVIARTLAYAWNLPCLGVHHMEGHLLAAFLTQSSVEKCVQQPVSKLAFPFLGLLVSGGHSQLILAHELGAYELLGETLDDAAGEAFDKVATLLELPYPGGPALERLAQHGQHTDLQFPRPMANKPGLDFSFSGLKTHCLQTVQQFKAQGLWSEQKKAEIAWAFQAAVVESLLIKCKRAVQQTDIRRLVLAGGVSANQYLRAQFDRAGFEMHYPPLAFCTDNGAMIAYVGACRLQMGQQDHSLAVDVLPRWSLAELLPIS